VSNEFDVVVIGGGPVGLWLALRDGTRKSESHRVGTAHQIPRIDDPRSNPGGICPAGDRGALSLTGPSDHWVPFRRAGRCLPLDIGLALCTATTADRFEALIAGARRSRSASSASRFRPSGRSDTPAHRLRAAIEK
jgi:hypothetical protein